MLPARAQLLLVACPAIPASPAATPASAAGRWQLVEREGGAAVERRCTMEGVAAARRCGGVVRGGAGERVSAAAVVVVVAVVADRVVDSVGAAAAVADRDGVQAAPVATAAIFSC